MARFSPTALLVDDSLLDLLDKRWSERQEGSSSVGMRDGSLGMTNCLAVIISQNTTLAPFLEYSSAAACPQPVVQYDECLNVIAFVDAEAHRTEFTRDEAGRVTQVTNDAGQSIAYTYDERNRIFTLTDPTFGPVTRMEDSDGLLTYSYDAIGRLTGYTAGDEEAEMHVEVSYAYDRDNKSCLRAGRGRSGRAFSRRRRFGAAVNLAGNRIGGDLAKDADNLRSDMIANTFLAEAEVAKNYNLDDKNALDATRLLEGSIGIKENTAK